jgi:hypothetical protein
MKSMAAAKSSDESGKKIAYAGSVSLVYGSSANPFTT